jgi:hypothetical protein
MIGVAEVALGALVVEEAEHYYHEYVKDKPVEHKSHDHDLTPDDVRDEMHKQLEAGALQRMQSVEESEEWEDEEDTAPVVMPACELQYLEARIGDYVGEDEEIKYDEPDEEDIEEMQAPVYQPVYGIDPGIREGDRWRTILMQTEEGRARLNHRGSPPPVYDAYVADF